MADCIYPHPDLGWANSSVQNFFKYFFNCFIADEEPKTLADVAHSCAEAPGPSSPTSEKPHKSLAEAAMEYQEHMSPPKAQPARVTVVTGEEEERNVLQVISIYDC